MGQTVGSDKYEEKMKYARVISIEFKSAEDLDEFYGKWDIWFPDNMPLAVSRTMVRTASNSTLMMAVYDNEEIAEEAKAAVRKFFDVEAVHVHDIIEFHGEVMRE